MREGMAISSARGALPRARAQGPSKGRATIVTLSQLAGVSASTVSRALKNDPRISEETRNRIAALASKAGYTPNAFARTLSSGRSGLLGIVLGSVQNPFYSELLEEAVAQAAARGMRLLIVHAGGGPIEDRTAEALLQYQVDGCIITSAELSSNAVNICAANGVPVVMVNRIPRLHASAVACDNAEGGRELARFLVEGGHKRIAMVQAPARSSTGMERVRGFVEQLTALGLEPAMRMDGGGNYDGGFACGQEIAKLPAGRRPDAIFGISDVMAMGAMDALRLAGIRVPEDISVVAFDNISAASHPPYGLTTIAQPLQAMVHRGLDILMARIRDPSLPDEAVQLRGRLIVRRSSRVPGG